jgi:hypothetical protein
MVTAPPRTARFGASDPPHPGLDTNTPCAVGLEAPVGDAFVVEWQLAGAGRTW